MIDRRQLIASAVALGVSAVAGSASALARTAVPKPLDPSFPNGFLWGASTAAHQVEGNNLNADLWVMENVPGTIYADRSGDAANSFELWPVDLDLVKAMGLNSYRFSLEWARVEPDKGHFSNAMLDHYKAMIDGCRQRGLNPVVTFNHFTTPRWFAAQGGWHNAEAAELFARFCDKAARHLAEGIEGQVVTNLFEEDGYFADADHFWTAQMAEVGARKAALIEEGWSDVIVIPPHEHFSTWEHEKTPKRKGARVCIQCRENGEVVFHEGYVTTKEAQRIRKADVSGGATPVKPTRPEVTSTLATYVDLHPLHVVLQWRWS